MKVTILCDSLDAVNREAKIRVFLLFRLLSEELHKCFCLANCFRNQACKLCYRVADTLNSRYEPFCALVGFFDLFFGVFIYEALKPFSQTEQISKAFLTLRNPGIEGWHGKCLAFPGVASRL